MPTKKEIKEQKIRDAKQKLMQAIQDRPPKVCISEKMMCHTDAFAEVDVDTLEIVINPKKNTLEDSIYLFIHEYMHITSPTATENEIFSTSKHIYKDMSIHEKQKIFRFMARKAQWVD